MKIELDEAYENVLENIVCYVKYKFTFVNIYYNSYDQ